MRDGRAWVTAAILPNRQLRGAAESFAVSVSEVEEKTGLKFFHLLEPGR